MDFLLDDSKVRGPNLAESCRNELAARGLPHGVPTSVLPLLNNKILHRLSTILQPPTAQAQLFTQAALTSEPENKETLTSLLISAGLAYDDSEETQRASKKARLTQFGLLYLNSRCLYLLYLCDFGFVCVFFVDAVAKPFTWLSSLLCTPFLTLDSVFRFHQFVLDCF